MLLNCEIVFPVNCDGISNLENKVAYVHTYVVVLILHKAG